MENIFTLTKHNLLKLINLPNCWVRSSGDQNVSVSITTCMEVGLETFMCFFGLEKKKTVTWCGECQVNKVTHGWRLVSMLDSLASLRYVGSEIIKIYKGNAMKFWRLKLFCVAGTLISCLIHRKVTMMKFLRTKDGYGLSLLNPKSPIAKQLFFHLRTKTYIKSLLLLYYLSQVIVR